MVLAALLIAALQAQSLDQRENVRDLQKMLGLPDQGMIYAESRQVLHGISQESRAASLTYLRELQSVGWHSTTEAGTAWLKGRSYVHASEWRPAILDGVRSQTMMHARYDSMCVQSDSSRILSHELPDAASPTPSDMVLTRLRMCDEVIAWHTVGGQRGTTERLVYDTPKSALYGSFYVLAEFFEQVNRAIEVASIEGTICTQPQRVSWSLDLNSADLRARSLHAAFPIGLSELPCLLFGELTHQVDGSILSVEWSDSFGRPLCRQQVEWGPKEDMPRVFKQDHFLPGDESHVRSLSMAFASSATGCLDEDLIRWTPVPGELVLDRRFGNLVSYRAGRSGEVPSDEELLKRAGTGLRSKIPPEAAVTAELLIPATSSADGQDRVSEACQLETNLGRHAVGSVVRVDVKIVNLHEHALEIGSIRADCGCTTPQLSTRDVPPGQTSMLTVVQEIKKAGNTNSRLAFPVKATGGQWEVMIEFKYTGVPNSLKE